MSLKTSLNNALEKIGRVNGHAPQASQVKLDAAAHDYEVASIGQSYFEKRRELAKKALIAELGPVAADTLEATKKLVKKIEQKQEVELGRGQFFTTYVAVTKGATYIDVDALRVDLKRIHTSAEIDALFDKHTKRRDPTVSYRVLELGDQ